MRMLWLLGFLLLVSGPVFAGGICRSGPVAGETRHEFEFFAGYSPGSATLIGTTTDRRFVAAGFDYSYRCWAWQHVSISFTPGAMPAAILLEPAQTLFIGIGNGYETTTTPSHAVYGFGVTPLGFTFDFARTRALYPFFEIDGGLIASTEPIPVNVTDATGLNFLFDFGGGVKWRPRGHRSAITFGYKFLHISNAFTTPVNPGVDNNVIYVGYSLLR